MAEIAERGVNFILRASTDPTARTVVEDFAKTLVSAQSQVDRAAAAASRAIEESIASVEVQVRQTVEKTVSAAEEAAIKSAERQAQVEEKEIQERLSAIEQGQARLSAEQLSLEGKSLDELEALRESRIADRLAKEEAKYLEAMNARIKAERAYEEISEAARKQVAETGRALSKEEIDIIRQIEKARDSLYRESEAAEKRWTSVQEAEQDRRLNLAIVEQKKKKSLQEEADDAAKAAHEKVQKLIDGGKEALSGALLASTQLTRGLALLGIAGEKDVGRLTESIIRLQGALEAFEGFLSTVQKLEKAYRAWTAATVAQTAAEEALSAARLAGAGAGSAAAGVRGAIGAEAAEVAGSVGANAVGGLAGGVAGTVVAGKSGGFIAANMARIASWGTKARVATAPLVSGAAGLASRAGPHAAAFGVGYLIGSGARNAYEEATLQDDPFGGALKVTKNLIDIPTLGWGSWIIGEGAFETQRDRRLKREEKEYVGRVEALQRKNQLNDEDRAEMAGLASQKTQLSAAEDEIEKRLYERKLKSMTVDERRAEIAAKLAEAQKAAQTGDESSHAKVITLLERRLEGEREIYSIQKTAAEQQLSAAQRALDMAKSKLESEQNSLLSAKERFGMMDAGQQQELVALADQFRKNKAIMPFEEIRKLSGLSTVLDREMKEEAIRRADKAGFDKTVGLEAVKEIEKIQREIKTKLEIDVKAKADVVVKLQTDYEAIAKVVDQQIEKEFRAVLKLLAGRMTDNEGKTRELEKRFRDRNLIGGNGGIP